MKKVFQMFSVSLSLLVVLFTGHVSAQELDQRHKDQIYAAIQKQCGLITNPEVLSTQVMVDRVDNGITDYYFTTEVSAYQNHKENGHVSFFEVKSILFSAYDHVGHEWGLIDIRSVKCL